MSEEKQPDMQKDYLTCAMQHWNGPAGHHNCAQSVLFPFAGECGISEEKADQLASLFGSGMRMGGCCGAITGGLMAIGMLGGGSEEYRIFMDCIRKGHNNLVNCPDILKKDKVPAGDRRTCCDRIVYDAVENVLAAMRGGYRFYGWETALVPAAGTRYPGIHTPRDLYDALTDCWCKETCTERLREEWSKENPTLGQCTITAFLAQDIFGGKVYGIQQPGGNYHCYNVVGDCIFDLTSEQFGADAESLIYRHNPEQFRKDHFAKDDKNKRYELLKSRLQERSIQSDQH